MDKIREKLFKYLDITLNELRAYDIASLMPLLYVVVAHKEGHRLSIISENEQNIFDTSKRRIQSVKNIDGYESDLLEEIYNSVNPIYFEGQAADIVYRFYDFYCAFTEDFYQEVVEYIIAYYSARGARYDGISITPTEIACLMAALISRTNPHGIYDPCAGLCSYLIQPELKDNHFLGQEINRITKVVADVRLDAAKRSAKVYNEDSMKKWRGNEFVDCLASELPFGVRLNLETFESQKPRMLEDAVLSNFINTPALRSAVLLVSISTCNRRDNLAIRSILCEQNWIDCVVKMPAGILPNTGIYTAIIVLKKDRTTNHIRLVSAEDCIINDGKRRKLDYQSVIDRLFNFGMVPEMACLNDLNTAASTGDGQAAFVSVNAISEHGFSLDPSVYLQERIEILPGQKLVKFLDLVEPVRIYSRYEETQGRVLQPEQMFESIIEMHTSESKLKEKELQPTYIKVCDKCIIFNVRADKFFIKNDEEPLYFSRSYKCFAVKENKCLPEYLADCVVGARNYRESAMVGMAMQRVDWNHLLLPFYDDLESQRQIVQRIYREEQKELKKKLESLQVLSGKSSDLIHNLGVTFTKISAGIGKMRDQMNDETVESLNDNVQFALRQINSTGTDYGFVQPEKEKVNLIYTLVQYLKAWDNFGYKTFTILPIKREVSQDTKVELDTNLFYTMLDCIFINAHQHGFNKRENPENKVLLEVEGVIYNDEQYVRLGISNNGKPLPANFTLQDFITRGVVGINSSQDGIGGDHVFKIAKKHDGFVSIESDSEWLTFNILLPVYLTSNETKFNDYECECV